MHSAFIQQIFDESTNRYFGDELGKATDRSVQVISLVLFCDEPIQPLQSARDGISGLGTVEHQTIVTIVFAQARALQRRGIGDGGRLST